ncbi:MAG: nickel transport complex protein, NikM subunit, transmembrane [Osedax symbiont Rs1]|nr:MAG: nickel transport complex protein, NikM subunit, transmembrane [Osedax symbiont Rs1]
MQYTNSLASSFEPLNNNFKRVVLAICLSAATPSFAHFQEIIPDRDFLNAANQQPLRLALTFTHPMTQGPVMNMLKPKSISVLSNNNRQDLLTNLVEEKLDSSTSTWSLTYQATQPGDLVFYVEPQPYWEASEGKMIIHYSKVIVDGFGAFAGWDALVGLPIEIEPLTRPYSLWTGNAFQGVVKKAGQPLPFAEIEVEWRSDGTVTPATDSYITQVIKADANGTFSYVMPKAGWWGFAALIEADYTLAAPNGKQVPVELGGLIWINAKDMK